MIILYLSYLIVDYKYKEYKINNHIEYIEDENSKVSKEIETNKNSLEYLASNAYKNKILKEEQWYKNRWENVIFITNESEYNLYTKQDEIKVESNQTYKEKNIYDSMNIKQRWIYFIFNKDVR